MCALGQGAMSRGGSLEPAGDRAGEYCHLARTRTSEEMEVLEVSLGDALRLSFLLKPEHLLAGTVSLCSHVVGA